MPIDSMSYSFTGDSRFERIFCAGERHKTLLRQEFVLESRTQSERPSGVARTFKQLWPPVCLYRYITPHVGLDAGGEGRGDRSYS